MDNDRAQDSETRPLPSFDRPAMHRRPDYGWYGEDYGPPPHYSHGGYLRDSGIRGSRRAMGWTAAALIATVAATTGYLAHAIPVSTGSSTSTGTTHSGKSTSVAPSGPAVSGPVVTSGGSGVAGSHGDN
jgi:hypothetical protein